MSGIPIHYDGKVFCAFSKSADGEVSSATVFHYHQDADVLWAEYSGGEILRGFMVGLVHPDGRLEFNYHHVNSEKKIRAGTCRSRPEALPDGRIRLHETWQWLDGERQHGVSIVDELKEG